MMTVKAKINSHNNNYSFEERLFQKTTGLKLVMENDYVLPKIGKIDLPSLSVIIPYYNDQKSIVHTLNSINKQINIDFD